MHASNILILFLSKSLSGRDKYQYNNIRFAFDIPFWKYYLIYYSCFSAGNLDQLFEGTGYITIGYYKSEEDSLGTSVKNMTARLAEISEINASSHVLDLGCGKGIPALDIAMAHGCSVVGVDLAEKLVEIGRRAFEKYRQEKPDLKAEFHAASYFELPEAVMSQRFTHVLMQTSLFYVLDRIDEVFAQVSKLLKPGGVFVAAD